MLSELSLNSVNMLDLSEFGMRFITYPLHPGWDIRPQSYLSNEPYLVLRPTICPSHQAQPSQFSTKCFSVCLAFSFQFESISKQPWGFFHLAPSGHDPMCCYLDVVGRLVHLRDPVSYTDGGIPLWLSSVPNFRLSKTCQKYPGTFSPQTLISSDVNIMMLIDIIRDRSQQQVRINGARQCYHKITILVRGHFRLSFFVRLPVLQVAASSTMSMHLVSQSSPWPPVFRSWAFSDDVASGVTQSKDVVHSFSYK
ncbi:Uncharacterised protein r2_g2101 [Pycnogonum litorale]